MWIIAKSLHFYVGPNANTGPNPNCVMVGAIDDSAWNNAGLTSDGEINYKQVAVGGWHSTVRSSGLNNDTPHLFGFVHNGAGTESVKLYVDSVQAGATEVDDMAHGVVDFSELYTGWTGVGAGSAAAPNAAPADFGAFVVGALVVRTAGSPWGATEIAEIKAFAAGYGI